MTEMASTMRDSGGAKNSARFSQLVLILPLAVFSALVVFAPLLVIAVKSVNPTTGTYDFSPYARIFADTYTFGILVSTIRLGVITTVVVAIVSYPVALTFLFASPRQRTWLAFFVVLPLLTSTVVRTFAWIVILGREGPLSEFLIAAGILREPLRLLFTDIGVVIALGQIELPLMILPLATSLIHIDQNLLAASHSLGAGYWRTFRKIILPLSLPGLIAGCTLVFASSVSAFITQAVIGGGKRVYMPLLIYQQATDLNNFPSASALAILLLATVVVMVTFLGALGRLYRRTGHV